MLIELEATARLFRFPLPQPEQPCGLVRRRRHALSSPKLSLRRLFGRAAPRGFRCRNSPRTLDQHYNFRHLSESAHSGLGTSDVRGIRRAMQLTRSCSATLRGIDKTPGDDFGASAPNRTMGQWHLAQGRSGVSACKESMHSRRI